MDHSSFKVCEAIPPGLKLASAIQRYMIHDRDLPNLYILLGSGLILWHISGATPKVKVPQYVTLILIINPHTL